MFKTRPTSELINDFSVDEEEAKREADSITLISLEQNDHFYDEIELSLDEADRAAEQSDIRYSSADVFARMKKRIHERKY